MVATSERGATAVEFSLIALLLFTLLLGTLQFGLTYHRLQGIHAAAREGARLASLGAGVDVGDVEQRVRDTAPAFLDPADLAVTVRDTSGANTGSFCTDLDGDDTVLDEQVTVEVEVTGDYGFGLPLIGPVTPRLDADAMFQCEQAQTP